MTTRIHSLAVLVGCFAARPLFFACAKSVDSVATASTSNREEPEHYPLKGVIVDVQTGQSALLVKHEDIAGLPKRP